MPFQPTCAELANLLPELPGIYLVFAGESVLYIGQTVNLRNRWRAHHRHSAALQAGADKVRWIDASGMTDEERAQREADLITSHLPLLCRETTDRAPKPPDTRVLLQVRFPAETWEAIQRHRATLQPIPTSTAVILDLLRSALDR